MSGAGDDDGAHRGRLRRADKIMGPEEIESFLLSARCARVATVGADGYPYVMPTLFVRLDGLLYVHTTAHAGHFLANVRHEARVCFEIDDPGEVFPYGERECDTTIWFRSVIAFGRIRIVDTESEKRGFYTALLAKYAPADSWGRERGSFPRLDATIVYAIAPESVTGKQGLSPAGAWRR
jgi:uncharacterized protein